MGEAMQNRRRKVQARRRTADHPPDPYLLPPDGSWLSLGWASSPLATAAERALGSGGEAMV
eukprot:1141013-Pelagomonas_calceolata.AAC.10